MWFFRLVLGVIVSVLAGPALADLEPRTETVPLRIMVLDEDAQDWITVSNGGSCAAVSGRVRIDFGASAGSVVIDTEYGGAGTRDPAPVRVVSGPAVVMPVPDGARSIVIVVSDLPPRGQVIVTLDIDNERGWFEDGRVVATPRDIAGSTAEFVAPGLDSDVVRGVFADGRIAVLPVELPCADSASEPAVVPIA
ncbi:hypothetical protein [uncultured Roseicyclus sp.]|jgi:hypothetical protein|uniref:hypothetical protein n=1 Tax=uncultured Roseicyclus sp. TaxID=543072 RepID=UPI00260163A2|nr:hypothetical protein [uncultured Roseicyclus sp.]